MSSLGTTENYQTAGINNALNESQTRRNALLDKLKEAQDTLQVCNLDICLNALKLLPAK